MGILNRSNAKAERTAREQSDAVIDRTDTVEVVATPALDIHAELKALEDHVVNEQLSDEQRIEQANDKLSRFEMTPMAMALLERALDNVANNSGQNLEDEDARAKAETFSIITKASGNSLAIALDAISATETVSRTPATVYSYLFTVLKAATFIGNLDYRRAIDPKQDDDIALLRRLYRTDAASIVDEALAPPNGMAADPRDEHREPVPGLAPSEIDSVVQNTPALWTENVIVRALEELQLFFTLSAEGFGWTPVDRDGEVSGRLMPFCVVMAPDGKFESIVDATQALDRMEIKRAESKIKRRDAMIALRTKAAAAANAAVRAAMERNARK